MTAYLSEKIRILSFFSMVLVVFLHGQLISISSGYVLWVQQFVTGELTRIAVPLFFSHIRLSIFSEFFKAVDSIFSKEDSKTDIYIINPIFVLEYFWYRFCVCNATNFTGLFFSLERFDCEL